LDRRDVVKVLGLSPLAAAVLAACGSDDDDPPAGSGPAATRAADATATGSAASPAATTQAVRPASRGTLDVVEPFLPPGLDADEGAVGSQLLGFGVAEALMRYTPDLKPVPWVAIACATCWTRSGASSGGARLSRPVMR
jgi:hypothetical protein